ncbi:MAG: DUF4349 domain-containing protein [Defluviitaleaceae bacterium]|nr:DUF4349 domain-containing protein [Defluviitaleaceae bacterium]
MRKIAVCFLILVLAMLVSVPVLAQDRQLRQHHSIDIEVECLDAAMEIIRGLNGYNLEASVILHESPHDRGAQRGAFFVRRVDYWAFRHVQYVLRDMGEVHFETENAYFLGAQILDTDARITALTQEIERLSIMMAASDSLDVLIAIDARLSQVMLELNGVIGTRNVLISQAANPVIHINLSETMGERPEIVPPGFGFRVVNSFMGSLRTTGVVGGNLLVFFVRVFIPLIVFGAFGLVVVWVCVKLKRKRVGAPVPVVADRDIVASMTVTDVKEGEE